MKQEIAYNDFEKVDIRMGVKSVPIGHPFRFKLDAHYEINWTPLVF
jgi:hypothetical protein